MDTIIKRLLLILIIAVHDVASRRLALMGGAISQTNVRVWSQFVSWAGGSSSRIGVISAASADPPDSGNYYVQLLEAYGALEAYWVPIHEGNRDANSDPDVVDRINQMTGFFFSGGDQARIINSFYNSGVASPALEAIRSRYRNNAVVGGSSAGTACLVSAPMIMGGMSYNALRYGAYRHPGPSGDDLSYRAEGGLQILDGFITDTHFSERGREGRLVRLIADTSDRRNGVRRGIGVDENTCLFMDRVGESGEEGEVIGENGVFIPDLSSASWDDRGGDWRINDVRAHYLTDNDRIRFRDMSVTFASWKRTLAPERYERGITSDKIFNGNRDNRSNDPEFVRVSRSIFDAWGESRTWGRTERSSPRFRVTFTQDSRSRGEGEYNPTTGRWQIAYTDLNVDMGRD